MLRKKKTIHISVWILAVLLSTMQTVGCRISVFFHTSVHQTLLPILENISEIGWLVWWLIEFAVFGIGFELLFSALESAGKKNSGAATTGYVSGSILRYASFLTQHPCHGRCDYLWLSFVRDTYRRRVSSFLFSNGSVCGRFYLYDLVYPKADNQKMARCVRVCILCTVSYNSHVYNQHHQGRRLLSAFTDRSPSDL